MNFLKISPTSFFCLGAVITLLSNLGLQIKQMSDDAKTKSVSAKKIPEFAGVKETWLAGEKGDANLFVNGMGMKFVKMPDLGIGFGVNEVTREQFQFFVEAVDFESKQWNQALTSGGLTQGENHPVVNISWEDASQFCKWISDQEQAVYRLATDYEWSIAAGLSGETGFLNPGDRSKDTPQVYFWGDIWRTDQAIENYADLSHQTATGNPGCFPFNDNFPATSPVGSFKPNALGICDMGGNVSEWVHDWFQGREEFKTVRGGSYATGVSIQDALLKGFRAMSTPNFRSEQIGFRLVVELSSDPAAKGNLLSVNAVTAPSTKIPSITPISSDFGDASEATVESSIDPQLKADSADSIPSLVAAAVAGLSPTDLVAEQPVLTKQVQVLYSGRDGINLRQDKNFDDDKILGTVHKQSAMPIEQFGEDSELGDEIWVNIEIKGWIPVKNRTHTYLNKIDNGNWEVIWNKPGDQYVAMRAGFDSEGALISKVSTGTHIEELESKTVEGREYILGKIYGWVVKKNQTKTFIGDVE